MSPSWSSGDAKTVSGKGYGEDVEPNPALACFPYVTGYVGSRPDRKRARVGRVGGNTEENIPLCLGGVWCEDRRKRPSSAQGFRVVPLGSSKLRQAWNEAFKKRDKKHAMQCIEVGKWTGLIQMKGATGR